MGICREGFGYIYEQHLREVRVVLFCCGKSGRCSSVAGIIVFRHTARQASLNLKEVRENLLIYKAKSR